MATSTTASSSKESPTTNGKPRVIVLDDIADDGFRRLDDAGIDYEVRTGLKGDALREALQGFQGAICRSGVTITAEALEGNSSLRAIARAGVGTDNIDKEAATKLGIVVMNTPAGNTISTAEQTMALILGLSRKTAQAHASLMEGKWDRKSFKGTQLHGKVMGVIGLGRIGQEVASRCAAFGMTVMGYDPFLSEAQISALRVDPVSTIDALLGQVDYLTVHTPLTEETRGIVNMGNLDRLKPGIRLINCARGGIYEEAALVAGLESGQIGGVALDVFEQEPCTESPLFGHPNVLVTPHLGASTEEAQIAVATEAVELVINYLKTGEIRSAVNAAALDPKTLAELRGYLEAAWRLGIMLAGWHESGIDQVNIEYQGAIGQKDSRVLTSAFCAGLLRAASPRVNIVNAQAWAKERGISICASSPDEQTSLGSVISATVSGGGQSRSASVSVFGDHFPRLTEIGDFRTDAYIDGILMLFTHQDAPGVIGFVGSILAEEKVNISQMAVGRTGNERGGEAIGVLNLDSTPSEEALAKVTQYPGISALRIIPLPDADELPDWLN